MHAWGNAKREAFNRTKPWESLSWYWFGWYILIMYSSRLSTTYLPLLSGETQPWDRKSVELLFLCPVSNTPSLLASSRCFPRCAYTNASTEMRTAYARWIIHVRSTSGIAHSTESFGYIHERKPRPGLSGHRHRSRHLWLLADRFYSDMSIYDSAVIDNCVHVQVSRLDFPHFLLPYTSILVSQSWC